MVILNLFDDCIFDVLRTNNLSLSFTDQIGRNPTSGLAFRCVIYTSLGLDDKILDLEPAMEAKIE